MVKYEHSDAGLSFQNIKIKKLRTFQELWEKNQDIEEKKSNHQGFRHFREFMDIQEEDVVVTIEYWYKLYANQSVRIVMSIWDPLNMMNRDTYKQQSNSKMKSYRSSPFVK